MRNIFASEIDSFQPPSFLVPAVSDRVCDDHLHKNKYKLSLYKKIVLTEMFYFHIENMFIDSVLKTRNTMLKLIMGGCVLKENKPK